jgi:hypothetical protein
MTHWRGVRFSADEIMGVADNPVRREIERVATRVGLDFSLNAVLNRRNQLVDVKAGHHVAAHRAAVAVADPLYRVAPSARADVLIGGSASWASDLWSGIGAVFLGERFVRPGGTVVAAAPCPDGVAPHHPEILQYGYRPLAEIEAMVDAGRFSDLAAASHMTVVGRVRFGMGVRCILVSDGLGRDVVERLGLEWAPSLQEAVDRALAPYTQPVTVYACQAEDVADMMVLPRKDRGPVAA